MNTSYFFERFISTMFIKLWLRNVIVNENKYIAIALNLNIYRRGVFTINKRINLLNKTNTLRANSMNISL